MRPGPPTSQPRSIFADQHAVHPSFDALAERLLRNFTGMGLPKAERPEGLSIEVILSPEEAARGGSVSIGIPVHQVCAFCNGTGDIWPFACQNCNGQGVVPAIRPVQVRIPRSLSLGLAPEASLETLGVNNLFLRFQFRVSNELY